MSNIPQKSGGNLPVRNVKNTALVVGGVAALVVAVPIVMTVLGIALSILTFPISHPFVTLLCAGAVWGMLRKR